MTQRNHSLLCVCGMDNQKRVVLCERKGLALDFYSSGAQVDENAEREIGRLVLVPANFLLREVRFELPVPVGPIWWTMVVNHDQWSLIFAIEPHTERARRDGKSAEADNATDVSRGAKRDSACERHGEDNFDARV